MARPSWNFTPFFSVNVHVRPSLDTFQEVASRGSAFLVFEL